KTPKQTNSYMIVFNIVMWLLFFMYLIFLSLFWPSLISPCRLRRGYGAPREKSFPAIHGICWFCPALGKPALSHLFPKMRVQCQEKFTRFLGGQEQPASREPALRKATRVPRRITYLGARVPARQARGRLLRNIP